MRLTLRTLLAYQDDRLSPVNAREIGQKIANSPFARELADRIREVMRRRRLAAPAAQQKVIDPNMIAEYLDDQLTPELVALIEKEVLSSDFSLAEVAATHQILGLLKDDTELDPRVRERVQALDPYAEGDTVDGAGKRSLPAATTGEAWTPLAPQPTAQRRSPVWLLALLIVGWLILIATDSNLFYSRDTQPVVADADAPDQPEIAEADADADADADSAAADADDSVATAAASQQTPTPSGRPPTAPAATGDGAAAQPATTQQSATQPTQQPAVQTVPPVSPDPTTASGQVTADQDDTDASTSPPADPPLVRHRFTASDRHRMTAAWDPGSQNWSLVHKPGVPGTIDWTSVAAQNVLAVFEPFRLELTALDSGWSAMATGPTLLQALSTDVAGTRLLEGRIVVRHDPTNPATDDQPVQFRLLAGDVSAELTLHTSDTVLGIDVVPLPQLTSVTAAPPPAIQLPETTAGNEPVVNPDVTETAVADTATEPTAVAPPAPDFAEKTQPSVRLPIGNPAQVSVYVAEGSASVRFNDDPADAANQQIAKGRMISWIATANSVSAVEISPAGQLGVIPEWIYNVSSPPIPELEDVRARIAEEFIRSSSLAAAAISLSSDRNPQIASLGTAVLAVTRDLDQLVGLLLKSESENVRRAAIAGLQRAMYQRDDNVLRITGALENRLPGSDVEDALRLLNGITRTAAEDREVSAWLVGMLDSSRVPLRELAIYNLERLTDERYSFFADADASRRSDAIRRWQRHLARNDGRVVPAP